MVDRRLVGRWRLHVEAVAGVDRHPELGGHRCGLAGQPALAEPGRSADQHHPAAATGGRFEHRAELLAFADSADIRRRRIVGQPGVDVVVVRERHEVEPPLGGDALQFDGALIDQFVAGGAEHPVDGLGREDPPGWRKSLDPLGDDDGLAVEVAVFVDHLTGVQPDAHLHGGVEPVAVEATHLQSASRGLRRWLAAPTRTPPSGRRPSP